MAGQFAAAIRGSDGQAWGAGLLPRDSRSLRSPDSPEVTGSLADDIADVYRDLRTGLRKWQRGESGGALWEWRFNFEAHWGQHADDALRAIHSLSAWHDHPWPPVSAAEQDAPGDVRPGIIPEWITASPHAPELGR